jgi:hypothetical protein
VSAADAAAAQSAAISAAASDATAKANAAQSAAETTAAADATSKRNDVAQKLGYANWAAMETAATQGETIIDGGYLRTSLIEVENLLAQNITLQANGYIQSSNYTESDGKPTAGFKFDAANNLIKSYGGVFRNIELSGSISNSMERYDVVSGVCNIEVVNTTKGMSGKLIFIASFKTYQGIPQATYIIEAVICTTQAVYYEGGKKHYRNNMIELYNRGNITFSWIVQQIEQGGLILGDKYVLKAELADGYTNFLYTSQLGIM